MNIDLDKYKVNREFVRQQYLADPHDLGTLISRIACSTMCPCIVVAYWVGEFSNWHPEAVEAIKRLTKFYGYKAIFNKPPGSPV